MRTVRVIYEYYPESWVAESPDVPGWMAFGDSLREVRELTKEGIPFFVEEDVSIVDLGIRFKTSRPSTSTVGLQFRPIRTFQGRTRIFGRRPGRQPPTEVKPQPIPAI
jgi:predicted RNase H-like HicB family nuclease